jgi:hypothetical protein
LTKRSSVWPSTMTTSRVTADLQARSC